MESRYLIVIVTVIVIVAIVAYLFSQTRITTVDTAVLNERFGVVSVAVANVTYYAYLANTPALREEGYMNVTGLGNCDAHTPCIGMLFTFQNQTSLCFWMENTPIPLRQTWLNQSGYPTYTYVGTPYSKRAVCSDGQYVIETAPNTTIGGRVAIKSV